MSTGLQNIIVGHFNYIIHIIPVNYVNHVSF